MKTWLWFLGCPEIEIKDAVGEVLDVEVNNEVHEVLKIRLQSSSCEGNERYKAFGCKWTKRR